jgi:hypothetical protein
VHEDTLPHTDISSGSRLRIVAKLREHLLILGKWGPNYIFLFRVRIRKMGSQFAFGNENGEHIYTRAQLEGEIYQHDLSLRKIDEERLQLAEGLAKNDFLRRLIMRRRRERWLTVDRTKSRNRASRSTGTLR